MAKGPIWTHITIAASSLDYRSKASCFHWFGDSDCDSAKPEPWYDLFPSLLPRMFLQDAGLTVISTVKTSNRFWTKGSTKVTPRSNLCGTEVIVLNTICGLAFGQFWPQLFINLKPLIGWRVCLGSLRPWSSSFSSSGSVSWFPSATTQLRSPRAIVGRTAQDLYITSCRMKAQFWGTSHH